MCAFDRVRLTRNSWIKTAGRAGRVSMDRYRKHYREQHEPLAQASSAPKLNLHPYALAMEQMELGDASLLDENWLGAKACYLSAVGTLEQMPLADRRNLKNGLNRLGYVHLRLFEFAEAWHCFSKAYGRSPDAYRSNEAEAIMESIKAARKASVDNARDYTPGFFTGHL